jgi:hypothetical protein
MQRPSHLHHDDRKLIALWLAVGGTMAVIVALWILILPSQLAQDGRINLNVSQWYAARQNDVRPQQKSFSQVMAEQEAQLNAMDQSQTTQPTNADSVRNIGALPAAIESALQNVNAPAAGTNAAANVKAGTNAPTNVNAPVAVNAPKKP